MTSSKSYILSKSDKRGIWKVVFDDVEWKAFNCFGNVATLYIKCPANMPLLEYTKQFIMNNKLTPIKENEIKSYKNYITDELKNGKYIYITFEELYNHYISSEN